MMARRVGFALLGVAGFSAFHEVVFRLMAMAWPDYAAAAPTKSYTLIMLWARLVMGAAGAVGIGAAIGRLSRDRAVVTPLVIVITLGAAWVHLGPVWADYPAWYHALVILALGPLHGLGARLTTPHLEP